LPEECVDPVTGRGKVAQTGIGERVEFRMPQLRGFWGGELGRAERWEFWMRFTDGRDADPIALAALVDAAPPVIFDHGVRASSTVAVTAHLRRRPAAGWLAARVRTRHLVTG